MRNIKTVIRCISFVIFLCALGISTACADDTDIYSGGIVNVPPNVLIIFDTSGSMAEKITSGSVDYNPAGSYAGGRPVDRIYYKNGSSWEELKVNYHCVLAGKKPNTCKQWGYDLLNLSDISCTTIKDTLQTGGQYMGKFRTDSPYACPDATNPGSDMILATGRFVNFITSGADTVLDSKVDIAKKAVKDLLAAVPDGSVRFGLMRFHGSGISSYLSDDETARGGYLLASVGSSDSVINNKIDALQIWCSTGTCGSSTEYPDNPNCIYSSGDCPGSSGGTPLAETLAEAGLYFAGGISWANTSGQEEAGYPTADNGFGVGGRYTSPIEWRCQKNYIIVVTDGQPTSDFGTGNGDNIFTRANYISNKSIGHYYETGYRDIDRDGDSVPVLHSYWWGKSWDCPDGHDCLNWMDDTAKFLYDVDLMDTTGKDNPNGDSFNDVKYAVQGITTYTIGFGSGCDKAFLENVTNSDHGHGATYMAEDGVQLKEALTGIMGDIFKNNSNLVAPVVPVSKMNRVYSGNSLYISLFRPESGAVWKGNLKKFGFSDSGEILDKGGVEANFNLAPKPSSCWQYSINDGIEVNMGGAGEQLLHQAVRAFYTYNTNAETPPSTNLTDPSNAFDISNTALTVSTLGLSLTATAAEREDLIHFIRADGNYLPLTGLKKRGWVLGDILHSRPSVVRDGSKNIIFVGANDGFLHCFEDDESTTYEDLTDDDLEEKWCFIPWDLIPSMNLMKNSSTHQDLVDGSPVLFRSGDDLLLTFGLRRGGSKYYTLKVGAFDSKDEYIAGGYLSPQWKWDIDEDTLPMLGESWSEPRLCELKTGTTSETGVTALLIAGGYDSGNQDKLSPNSTDSYGKAIFAVSAASGVLLDSLLKFTPTEIPSMTHSIVDLISFDSDGDAYTDKIYAGDMGGQVFALKADLDTGSWTGRRLFIAGDSTAATAQLKFFYAPDIAIQGYQYKSGPTDMYAVNDHIYIGSGDREHPANTTFDNRFYGIKNRDDTTVLTETGLTDVTFYSAGYSGTHDVNFLKSNASNGWFIRLGYEMDARVRPGEKVVSSPIVYDGIVYFTTYVPSVSSTTDKCAVSGIGEGFLYAVNYLTGEAIKEFNFFAGNDTVVDGKTEVVLDERDRRKSLGGGIPTPPKLTVTKSGPVLIVGTETFPIPFKSTVNEYFWRQQ